MSLHYETGQRGPIKYRLIREARAVYQLALWCDCILGPHWHESGTFATKRDAYQALTVKES